MMPRAASSANPARPLGRPAVPPARVPLAARPAGAVPTAIANLPPRPATAGSTGTQDTRSGDAATAIRRVSICNDESATWPLPPASVFRLRPPKPF